MTADTFDPADADLFRRGYPNLALLVDGHKDDKRAAANASKAYRSGDPDVYRVTWPRAVAHAYVRIYAAGNRVATDVDTSPPTVDELHALLARVVPGLVETYEFHTRDALYLCEAVLGSEVVAGAVLDRFEQMKDAMWKSDNFNYHEFHTADALGYIWARCPAAVARALGKRRDAILEGRPAESPLTRRLALLPDGKSAFKEGDFIFYEASLQAKDSEARRAWAARYPQLDDWSARFHWLEGCEGLLANPMKNLHATPKWRVQQLLDDYGRLKHAGVVRLIAHLANRSYVSAAAQAWLAAHQEYAVGALSDLASTDEACREMLSKLRGETRKAPARPRDEAGLLAMVYENPADDAARLVLADYWSDKGDPRGELIVAQIRVARGEATAAETKRATTLTNKADVRKLVFGTLAPGLAPGHSRIERGFLAHAHVQKRTKELAADPAWATVTSLEFQVSSAGAQDVLLEQPAVLRGLERVGGLYPKAFARLATGKGDNAIREVHANVRGADERDILPAIDAGLPGLPRLERLTLRTEELPPNDLVPLLRGKVGAKLTRLTHDAQRIEPALIAWLALAGTLETKADLWIHWAMQYAPAWRAKLAPGEDGRMSALTIEHVRPPDDQFLPFFPRDVYNQANVPEGEGRIAATATVWIARALEAAGVDTLTRITVTNDGSAPVDAAAIARLESAARRQKRLEKLEVPAESKGEIATRW